MNKKEKEKKEKEFQKKLEKMIKDSDSLNLNEVAVGEVIANEQKINK